MENSGFSQNLKKGLGSPVAKVVTAFIVLCVVGLSVFAWKKLSSVGGPPAGSAQAGGFEVQGGKPRGATDPETAAAVGTISDEAARAAAGRGQSYAGPFVFEAENSTSTTGTSNPASSSLSNMANGSVTSAPLRQLTMDTLVALRKRVAEFDATEESTSVRDSAGQGGSRIAQIDGGGNSIAGANRTGPSAGPNGDYGVGQEGFKQITAQLARIGAMSWSYSSLPGGALTRAPAAPSGAQVANGDTPSGSPPVQANPSLPSALNTANSRAEPERVAARAGSTCPALPDSSYDTDIALPVFATLQNCGDLTGARVKGTLVKSVDNFSVRFNGLFLDPARRLKLVGAFDAFAVSIEKDGDPRIADNVDNHWWTRIGSSALLSLAKTEQQFITARGTTVTNTGVTSSTAIEPIDEEQKRTARIAGVMQGALQVVSTDVGTGVNRQPTMTMRKTTLIGVQFLDDVKVVRID